jgi:hypothetical protein
MWTVERIVVGFLIYAALAAWRPGVPWRRRVLVTLVCGANAALVWRLAAEGWSWWPAARAWHPALQILLCYWISGALFVRPMPGLEAWLLRSDDAFFTGLGLRAAVARAPRLVLELVELAYLLVYPVVPAGFLAAVIADPAIDADRYWSVVVSAELACYAALPWLQSRPPRALGSHAWIDARQVAVRRLNARVLHHGSIQVNTIPSAHAAGAVATALAVGAVSPVAGVAFALVAAGIVMGSVAGRYHYAVDALLGIAVAIAVWRQV